ncbi:MAG: phosphate ABC transporter substrate-binding protein [Methyloprofundus sp.]|nr:phosphate ABC transporter substrate-binding protein [Methyloprofundus sp.]MDT8426148.1 phosphate ABC transporter substrate-binding protein [Methyloprofundus sp.]
MKKITLITVLLIITGIAWFFLPMSENNTTPEVAIEKLVLTGSSTVAPLASEIAKRFETLHPNVRIDVQTGGSSRGINDARTGLADIGMASRALKNNETDLLSFTIALDGISMIINQANPITALDQQQIIAIYTGKILNWQDVGGNDAPITVVNKAEGRSTLELFLHHFGLSNTEIKPHVVIGDNQQGIKTVSGNPNAIGYVSVGSAEYEAMHNVPIKLLPLDNIVASVENIRNRSFPLSRPLNLVTREAPTGTAKAFIDFASSAQINDLIEAQYFVPVAY